MVFLVRIQSRQLLQRISRRQSQRCWVMVVTQTFRVIGRKEDSKVYQDPRILLVCLHLTSKRHPRKKEQRNSTLWNTLKKEVAHHLAKYCLYKIGAPASAVPIVKASLSKNPRKTDSGFWIFALVCVFVCVIL